MTIVQTDRAPAPKGHYSQAISHGGLVYVSGQLPVRTDRQPEPLGSVGQQTARVMQHVEAILEAAGSGLDRIVQVTLYVADLASWPEVNEAYAAVMGGHRPARAVVPTGPLAGGASVEVQVIAALRGDD